MARESMKSKRAAANRVSEQENEKRNCNKWKICCGRRQCCGCSLLTAYCSMLTAHC